VGEGVGLRDRAMPRNEKDSIFGVRNGIERSGGRIRSWRLLLNRLRDMLATKTDGGDDDAEFDAVFSEESRAGKRWRVATTVDREMA